MDLTRPSRPVFTNVAPYSELLRTASVGAALQGNANPPTGFVQAPDSSALAYPLRPQCRAGPQPPAVMRLQCLQCRRPAARSAVISLLLGDLNQLAALFCNAETDQRHPCQILRTASCFWHFGKLWFTSFGAERVWEVTGCLPECSSPLWVANSWHHSKCPSSDRQHCPHIVAMHLQRDNAAGLIRAPRQPYTLACVAWTVPEALEMIRRWPRPCHALSAARSVVGFDRLALSALPGSYVPGGQRTAGTPP
jgi:hypothetical protein